VSIDFPNRLLDEVPDLIAYLDPDLHYRYTNKAYQKAMRMSAQELDGKSAFKVLPEAFYELLRPKMEAALEGQVIEFETELPGPEFRWLHVRYVPDCDDAGKVLGFFAILTDITERKRAEEGMRNAQERLSSYASRLVEAQRLAKIGNWDRDLTTNGVWLSEECYRLLGRTPETFEPSRESFFDLLHPEDRERVRRTSEDAIAAGKSCVQDYRILLPDGSVRNMLARNEVVVDQEGRAVRITGTIQDITERVVLEREVVSVGEHERFRIGRDLHDGLGQELTAMSLGLQFLGRKLEEEQSRQTQTVQDLTATTQKMIAEIRRIARQLSPVFSTELGLCAALRALAKEIGEHSNVHFDVSCSFDDDIHDVEVATHLYRTAQESINNALTHGGARNIGLRYGRDGNSLFLEVDDDGTGIPDEAGRVDGLGLRSMSYRARMLHGRLEIGRRTQGGTRVLFSCPSKLSNHSEPLRLQLAS